METIVRFLSVASQGSKLISVELPDGSQTDIQVRQITPLYNRRSREDVPLRFVDDTAIKVGMAVYTVGDEIYVPNWKAVQLLINNVGKIMQGTLAMVDTSADLVIFFKAKLADGSQADYFLQLCPEEAEVIVKRTDSENYEHWVTVRPEGERRYDIVKV